MKRNKVVDEIIERAAEEWSVMYDCRGVEGRERAYEYARGKLEAYEEALELLTGHRNYQPPIATETPIAFYPLRNTMNASKENAAMALEKLLKIVNNIEEEKREQLQNEFIFIENFLGAAERKLPREESYRVAERKEATLKEEEAQVISEVTTELKRKKKDKGKGRKGKKK